MNTTTVTSDERIARAELTWIAEPRDRLLGALVRASGAVEAMALIRAGRLPHGTGLTANPGWQRAMSRWHAALEKVPPRGEVERTLGGRFRLVYPGCAEWPGGLDDLGDAAPVALWVTGVADLRFSCLRSVAVTGARAATAYGAYLGCRVRRVPGRPGVDRGLRGFVRHRLVRAPRRARGRRGDGRGRGRRPRRARTRPRTPTCSTRSPRRARSSARRRPGHVSAGCGSRPGSGSSPRSPPGR